MIIREVTFNPPRWLFCLAVLLNLSALFSGLHMDDWTNIYNAGQADWTLSSLGTHFYHGGRASQDGYLPAGYERPVAFYFRPLLVALFKTEYKLFGLNGLGYHLVNILFHMLNALLLMVLLRRLTGNPSVSSLAVLLFLCHAPSMAACAWVSGCTELVVATFFLATMLCYTRFRDSGGCFFQLLAFLLTLVAQGIKEQACLFPLLLAAYDRFLHQEKRFTAWPVLFAAPVVAALCYRSTLPGVSSLPPASFYFHPPSEPGFFLHLFGRLCESVLGLGQILCFVILPYLKLTSPRISAPLALAAALIAVPLWRRVRKEQSLVFFALWLFLFIGPSLMCTQLPLYLYLPAMASCTLLAIALHSPASGGKCRGWPFVIIVAWIVFALAASLYTSSWLSEKHRRQIELLAAVKSAAHDLPGPLRVHLFNASLPFSAFRSLLKLGMPDRRIELHIMTVSSLLLSSRRVKVDWLSGESSFPVIEVDEGKRHPYFNERFSYLHTKPIAFTVGDRVETRDYSISLLRRGENYFWRVAFSRRLEKGWLFFVLQPCGCERILPGIGRYLQGDP